MIRESSPCLACGNQTINYTGLCAACARDMKSVSVACIRRSMDEARGQLNIANIWLTQLESELKAKGADHETSKQTNFSDPSLVGQAQEP